MRLQDGPTGDRAERRDMVCAMVLWVDHPFEKVDALLGLIKGAEIRLQSSDPREETLVLVARGHDRIPDSALGRLKELRYRVEDAGRLLAEVRARYPFADNPRIWRGDPFHEMNFLRWLVLEARFPGEPVLTMDADIVWRADPAELLGGWREGGSFLCLHSTCMAFIRDGRWYEGYREGLAKLSADPGFGAEYSKDVKGLFHDQALCQYLAGTGVLENDERNMTGHGFSERYFMSANPLGIAPRSGEEPLSFEQDGRSERVGGRITPFWHMQTWFMRYLFLVRFLPEFMGEPDIRVPFDRDGSDLGARLLSRLHEMVRKRQISAGDDPERWVSLTRRSTLYEAFFEGSLAREAFTERRWWKSGVWAQ
jgi:hypothetical protein